MVWVFTVENIPTGYLFCFNINKCPSNRDHVQELKIPCHPGRQKSAEP